MIPLSGEMSQSDKRVQKGPRLVVEGLFHRMIQYECYVNNPSVSYADSSPCTGEPFPCIICISFYRLTFWEPRDYRVVFIIQQKRLAEFFPPAFYVFITYFCSLKSSSAIVLISSKEFITASYESTSPKP